MPSYRWISTRKLPPSLSSDRSIRMGRVEKYGSCSIGSSGKEMATPIANTCPLANNIWKCCGTRRCTNNSLPSSRRPYSWSRSHYNDEVMMRRVWWGPLAIAGTLFVQGCETPQPTQDLLAPTEAQMKMRSFQTRTFDVQDRLLAMR